MSVLPQSLTLAQAIKLERLPEDTRVVGWSHAPAGPIVKYANGQRRVLKPDGRLGWRFQSA